MTAKEFSNDHDFPAEFAAALRLDAVRRAERPEEFWNGQRGRIRARIESGPVQRFWGMKLALTAAAVVICAALLMMSSDRTRNVAPQAAMDADQQLLLAVEHSLAAGTPEALEPVTPLLESSSNLNDKPISHKEQHNEN